MRVVSDSSPLILLARMGQADLLANLFRDVFIPREVWREIQANPNRVDAKALVSLSWLRVVEGPAPGPLERGAGERAAIALAQSVASDLLLVDDRQARRTADRLNIRTAGTASILEAAFRAGLIADLGESLTSLRKAGGWISDEVVTEILDRSRRELAARPKSG